MRKASASASTAKTQEERPLEENKAGLGDVLPLEKRKKKKCGTTLATREDLPEPPLFSDVLIHESMNESEVRLLEGTGETPYAIFSVLFTNLSLDTLVSNINAYASKQRDNVPVYLPK